MIMLFIFLIIMISAQPGYQFTLPTTRRLSALKPLKSNPLELEAEAEKLRKEIAELESGKAAVARAAEEEVRLVAT